MQRGGGRVAPSLLSLVRQIPGDPAERPEQHLRKGASIEFLKERLTFEPGCAEAMAVFQLNMVGSFAQFGRDLIRQRQAEGIVAAKKRGVYKGRPRSLDSETIREVRNPALAGTPEHGSHVSTGSVDPRCTAASRHQSSLPELSRLVGPTG